MEDRIEERLQKAAAQIVPDRAVQERVLEEVKAKKVSRKRLSVRVPAAVLAACMLLGLLWFGGGQSLIGEEFVVYAATEDQGWQRLKEGEKILLKQEHYYIDLPDDENFEVFDEFGHCNYFPYRCTFRVDVPEDYLYDNSYVGIGDDVITQQRDVIEWWVAPERPEDVGKVRQGTIRIWIVSDKIVKGMREHIARLDLELTKEDGKCYAELKRVWESSAYKGYKGYKGYKK